MKTKTFANGKVQTQNVTLQDVIQDLQHLTEKMNLCFEQNQSLLQNQPVKYTRVKLGSGTTHLFEIGAQSITIDFQTNISAV